VIEVGQEFITCNVQTNCYWVELKGEGLIL